MIDHDLYKRVLLMLVALAVVLLAATLVHDVLVVNAPSAYAAIDDEDDEGYDDEYGELEDEDLYADGQSIAVENNAPAELEDSNVNEVNVTQNMPTQTETQVIYQAPDINQVVELVARVKEINPETIVSVDINVSV